MTIQQLRTHPPGEALHYSDSPRMTPMRVILVNARRNVQGEVPVRAETDRTNKTPFRVLPRQLRRIPRGS